MPTLLTFLVLQFFDALTTVVFLRHGVHEANPLIAAGLRITASPALPLLAVKLTACSLAALAWRSGRIRLLRRANLFFTACVLWNLLALAAA
jgi:hypothetical protein